MSFVGADGLRAGWGIVLFVLLAAVIGIACGVIIYAVGLAGMVRGNPSAPPVLILGELVSFAAVAIAALIMSRIEHRPFSRYGMRRTHILPDFMGGIAWGLVMLSVLASLLYLTGGLVFAGVALATGPAVSYGLLWMVGFLLVGLFEEFGFRGYLQFTLARGVRGIARAAGVDDHRAARIGFWVSAIVFSVIVFAGVHTSNGGETVMGIVTVGLAGLVFVFSLWWTGSLWWAIGFHASWDWAQSYLYGVADSGNVSQGHLLVTHPAGSMMLSGGTAGPEGSILVIPVLLATLVVIAKTLPRRPAPGLDVEPAHRP